MLLLPQLPLHLLLQLLHLLLVVKVLLLLPALPVPLLSQLLLLQLLLLK